MTSAYSIGIPENAQALLGETLRANLTTPEAMPSFDEDDLHDLPTVRSSHCHTKKASIGASGRRAIPSFKDSHPENHELQALNLDMKKLDLGYDTALPSLPEDLQHQSQDSEDDQEEKKEENQPELPRSELWKQQNETNIHEEEATSPQTPDPSAQRNHSYRNSYSVEVPLVKYMPRPSNADFDDNMESWMCDSLTMPSFSQPTTSTNNAYQSSHHPQLLFRDPTSVIHISTTTPEQHPTTLNQPLLRQRDLGIQNSSSLTAAAQLEEPKSPQQQTKEMMEFLSFPELEETPTHRNDLLRPKKRRQPANGALLANEATPSSTSAKVTPPQSLLHDTFLTQQLPLPILDSTNNDYNSKSNHNNSNNDGFGNESDIMLLLPRPSCRRRRLPELLLPRRKRLCQRCHYDDELEG